MKQVRCCNSKCTKVVGEIETGKARFKCKHCGVYTTAEVTEHKQPAPPVRHVTRFAAMR